MVNAKIIDDLSLKFKELYENGPPADVRRNFNALLQGTFTKLALVSREEFDVQAELLRVAREKQALLEKRLLALEESLHKNNK